MGILARLISKSPARNQPSDVTKSTALYRAVQIVPGTEGCCSQARAVANQLYLSHEIPRLPLQTCDFGNCQCTYKLFDDRRIDLRRASDTGFDMASTFRNEADLRQEAGDRRKAS